MPPCRKKYVYIKIDGCSLGKRIVYGEGNQKYVKLNSQNVQLSTLRGRYRYSDRAT